MEKNLRIVVAKRLQGKKVDFFRLPIKNLEKRQKGILFVMSLITVYP